MNRVVPTVCYAEIESASKSLASVGNKTPILTNKEFDKAIKGKAFFKCENFQHVGSFKFRGAYNALINLSRSEQRKGVVAFSSGNHAGAMAYAAHLLNIELTVVMPEDAPQIKIANTRKFGAKVILYDRDKEDRKEIASRLMNERGLTIIPPHDNKYVIAGQGTAVKEFIDEVGHLDYLFVCVGGGGLLAGSAISAAHLSPDCLIYGVEPEAGNDVQQSFRSGEIVSIAVPNTIADGARTQQVGTIEFPILRRLVKDIVTVSDDQLKKQMKFFMENMKMIVEPTGCLAAAAVWSNSAIDFAGARIGIIVSGGNIGLEQYFNLLIDQNHNRGEML